MSRRYYSRLTGLWLVVATAAAIGTTTDAQAPHRPPLGQGVVTGDSVHVRSGASLNHYPVCKLSGGDRVTVVGKSGDWYEILPPRDSFSWISEEYVDSADNKNGVVNGDNVCVRAGSALPQHAKSRYAIQTLLSKGAELAILGQSPDGFLRITPPAGATLWVSSKFVDLLTGEDAVPVDESAEAIALDSSAEDKAAPAVAEVAREGMARGAGDAEASPLASLLSTREREQLEEIDEAVAAEIAKPVLERDFSSFIERYGVIAAQEEDEFARRYAEIRLGQIGDVVAVAQAARKVHELGDRAEARRREFLQARAAMQVAAPPAPAGLDAQGELRVSALYPPGSLPQRYRLVEPGRSDGRTVGYVEIPVGSTLDVDQFVGRFVGVRASQTRLQKGSVNPVPIFVASELVTLQRAEAQLEK